MTFAGTPPASVRDGTTIPALTNAIAATMADSPIVALSFTTAFMAHTFTFIASSPECAGLGNSAKPRSSVAEHAHPRRVLAPRGRVPRHLHAAKNTLGVRHENRKAPVRRGEPRDPARRAVGI